MSLSRRLFVGLLGLLPGALTRRAATATTRRVDDDDDPEECFHVNGSYRITQEQVDAEWHQFVEMQEAHNWMCSGYAVCRPAGLYCSSCHERIGD